MPLRTLTAFITLSDGSPFTGTLRITPLEEIFSEGGNIAIKAVDHAITVGELAPSTRIMVPGCYSFALLDGAGELQCFEAYVPDGAGPVSLFDLAVNTYLEPAVRAGVLFLAQGSSLMLLAPGAGLAGQYLKRIDSTTMTWSDPPGATWDDITGKPAAFPPQSHVHADATASTTGFMAPADKAKLDGIAPGATANASNAFLLDRANHTGTQPLVTIAGAGDAAGKNVGTGPGSVAAGDHTHPLATTSNAGLLSATDKGKLDALDPAAPSVPAPIGYSFSTRSLGFNITNMHVAAAPLELNNALGVGEGRIVIDLTNATSIRLNVSVSDTTQPSGCVATAQYSTDGGATWSNFHAAALNVPLDTPGQKFTGWVALPTAAKGDVLVRIVGYGGGSGSTSTVVMVRLDVR